ncbi:MAG: BspA family leucine-rich repeat surface protein [Enterococcus hulanensis]
MHQKKLLYHFLILGMVSGSFAHTVVGLASEQSSVVTETPSGLKAVSTGTESTIEQATQSTQEPSVATPAPSRGHAAVSGTQTNPITVGDWTLDGTTPGVVKILGYTGTQAAVVIPTANDLNRPGERVTLSKQVLHDIAANGTTTSVAFSQNGPNVVLDGTELTGVFFNCENLTSISLKGLDTSSVTSMAQAFYKCSNLEQVDVTGIDTSKVTTFTDLFANCKNLQSADLHALNTAHATDMRGLFQDCTRLTQVNLTGVNTANVTDLFSIFSNCVSLQALDLSGFDTANVTDMAGMFANCQRLTELTFSPAFTTSKVTDMSNMFLNCQALPALDVSGFDTHEVRSLRNLFSGCSSVRRLAVGAFDTSNVTDFSGMFNKCHRVTSLDVAGFNTSKATELNGVFNDCSSVSTLSLKYWDTSHVTTMISLFAGCSNLTSVDVSSFDTRNVVTMHRMFAECPKLLHLDLENFNTAKAGMQEMFVSSSPAPLLVHVETDVKLRAYDYAGDHRQAPVMVHSGAKGTFGSKGTSQSLYSLCITDHQLTQFDPTEQDAFVRQQLHVFKTQLQKTDPNYVATKWQYTEGVGGSTLDNKINASYTANWEPILTLGTQSVTKQVGTPYGETELRNNIRTLLNEDGESSLATDRSKVGISAVNTANKQPISLSQLTKTTGTYEITYRYGDASTRLKLQVNAVPVTYYTVTFKAETGGSLSGNTTVKAAKGGKVTSLPTVKTTSGYTFSGWYTATNKKVDPKTVTITGNTTFTAKFTKTATPVKKIAMYRLYNPNSGEHFYTATASERDKVKKAGWKYEGIGWYAPEKGKPVYRLYNPNAGDHHYTINLNEKNNLVKVGWRYEGISWYSGGTVKVYRQYNKNAKSGAHNYTTSKAENDHLVKVGWKAEGIGWYAL